MADLFLERDAVLSDCGKYRYLLRRSWDHKLPRALYIMLNPSTADAEVDDATIRSCFRLARPWGYGSLEVVNLFAWRATDPAELEKAADPVGNPRNADTIQMALKRCDLAICAWGAHPMAEERGQLAVSTVRGYKPAAYCLGTTKHGAPKHPLYIKTGTMPKVYRA